MKRFVFALVVLANTLVWAGGSVVAVSNGLGGELWLHIWDAVTWVLVMATVVFGTDVKLTCTKPTKEVE